MSYHLQYILCPGMPFSKSNARQELLIAFTEKYEICNLLSRAMVLTSQAERSQALSWSCALGRVWFSFRWATVRPAILLLLSDWLSFPPGINSAFVYPILPTIQHKPRLCPMDRDKNTGRRKFQGRHGSVYAWWSPAMAKERPSTRAWEQQGRRPAPHHL